MTSVPLATKSRFWQLDLEPLSKVVGFVVIVRLGRRMWGVSPKSKSPPGPIPLVWTVVSGLNGMFAGQESFRESFVR